MILWDQWVIRNIKFGDDTQLSCLSLASHLCSAVIAVCAETGDLDGQTGTKAEHSGKLEKKREALVQTFPLLEKTTQENCVYPI